jgi:phage shock protein A
MTLASLIQTARAEERATDSLTARHADMIDRTRAALAAGRDDLVQPAAQAVAEIETELAGRQQTLHRLQTQIGQVRLRVEAGHRRFTALRQGAIQARAVRDSRSAQGAVTTALSPSAADEAEDLIARVLFRDDPSEQAEILADINADLTHAGITTRLATAGFGAPTRITAAAVIARLTSN